MDTIEKLGALKTEAEEHVARLNARAKKIADRAKAEADPNLKEILSALAESFREQVDTSLDFMLSMIAVVGEGFAEVGEGELDEVIGLEPVDAKRILDVLVEYESVLTSMRAMANVTPDEIARIDEKIANVKGVQARVEELELAPESDEADGADEDEEGDDEETEP